MTILTNSPSPNKKNPDWNNQVKVGHGYYDGGAWHRAIDVAVKMFEAGRWDGRGLLVVNAPYTTHGKMPSFPADGIFVADLVEGVDYEFASDSLYPRDEPAEGDAAKPPFSDSEQVEIDGRDWQVVDRMTTAELQAVAPRVAESWQRDGVVARCELRLARGGRRSYLARQYRDGSYSRPWRGSLTAAF